MKKKILTVGFSSPWTHQNGQRFSKSTWGWNPSLCGRRQGKFQQGQGTGRSSRTHGTSRHGIMSSFFGVILCFIAGHYLSGCVCIQLENVSLKASRKTVKFFLIWTFLEYFMLYQQGEFDSIVHQRWSPWVWVPGFCWRPTDKLYQPPGLLPGGSGACRESQILHRRGCVRTCLPI